MKKLGFEILPVINSGYVLKLCPVLPPTSRFKIEINLFPNSVFPLNVVEL